MITIGIAGITGKFGLTLTSHLLKQPSVSLRGLCRNPSKLPSHLLSSPRIVLQQGDANDFLSARAFAKGCDVVICCYLGAPSLMEAGQRLLIDACEAEHVPRYIASDYTLDYRKLEYGDLPAKDAMKSVMEYAETKDGVKGVHVLIGVLMETWWSEPFGVWNAKGKEFRFWGTGEEKWECTTYGNAAEWVAGVAMDREAVGVMKFVGDSKSTREIARIFESVYNIKPSMQTLGSLEDLYKHMHETRAKDPSAVMSYMPMFYNYYCSNGQTHLGKDIDNDKYFDIESVTFEAFLSANKMEDLWDAKGKVGSEV